ncbi:signal peptidase I SipW [Neobacillus sp.]|uniref:signal peptidase I SipW n=1 Tax=Neobacillus sp. TaxID=2675273 RepID=UPI0028A15A15|nr:signal peptidase I [Neobacillus sp.]
MKKTVKIIERIITIILVVNVIIMTFLVISSKLSKGETQIFGYQLKTVLSGSMEPTFLTGSVIAIKSLNSDESGTLKKGDIITFQTNEKILVTHRIIGVTTNDKNVLYETKGDNNKTADLVPVPSEDVLAKYSGYTIPYVGYIIDFAQSKNGSALLLIGPGIILLGYAIFTLFQIIGGNEEKKQSIDTKENTV